MLTVQPGFSLLLIAKSVREREKELVSKKEPGLEDLENSQLVLAAKDDKACSGESTKGWPPVTSQLGGQLSPSALGSRGEHGACSQALRSSAPSSTGSTC